MSKQKKGKYLCPRNLEITDKANIVVTNQQSINLNYNSYTGVAELVDGNGIPYSQGPFDITKTYKGKKNRIITKAYDVGRNIGNFAQLLGYYDDFFAVDTNTIKLNRAYKLSCGVLFHANVKRESETEFTMMPKPHCLFLYFYNNNDINIELVSWCLACEEIKSISKSKNICLVVDSEFSKIVKFNSLKTPILENYILPPEIHLVYATSDKRDEWSNVLINFCDKEANNQLMHYKPRYSILKYQKTVKNINVVKAYYNI
ncbi:MAG: hypothetical protein IJS03_06725 [Eubacterium sp.]|nr:hypothetical protein [Eubacterium sp.]